jgi:hypothetical protein
VKPISTLSSQASISLVSSQSNAIPPPPPLPCSEETKEKEKQEDEEEEVPLNPLQLQLQKKLQAMGKQIKEGTRSFLFQRKLRTLLTR